MSHFVGRPPENTITTKTRRIPIGFAWFNAYVIFIYKLPLNNEPLNQVINMRAGNTIIGHRKGSLFR